MSSESECSAFSGDEKGDVDIGSEDSASGVDSEDDYYLDEETGAHVSADQILDKDKEAFEELHRLLYGSGGFSSYGAAPRRHQQRKQPTAVEKKKVPVAAAAADVDMDAVTVTKHKKKKDESKTARDSRTKRSAPESGSDTQGSWTPSSQSSEEEEERKKAPKAKRARKDSKK